MTILACFFSNEIINSIELLEQVYCAQQVSMPCIYTYVCSCGPLYAILYALLPFGIEPHTRLKSEKNFNSYRFAYVTCLKSRYSKIALFESTLFEYLLYFSIHRPLCWDGVSTVLTTVHTHEAIRSFKYKAQTEHAMSNIWSLLIR